jgi:hypothetical protein
MNLDSHKDILATEIIDSSWARVYQEALRQNKKVMYVCREGKYRSKNTCEDAQNRGEKDSTFLEKGIEGLYGKYVVDSNPPENEKAREILTELIKSNFLRIIKDEFDYTYPEYRWFGEQLAALEKGHIIERNRDYEFVTYSYLVQENVEVIKKQHSK